MPTPAIGGVGVLEDVTKMATIGFKAEGETLILIGHTAGNIGQSLWLRECHGREAGAPPPVDLGVERRHGEFVRELIAADAVSAVHDCADGGALVAITEMALVSNIGVVVALPDVPNPAAIYFAEDQSRYCVATSDPDALLAKASAAGVFAVVIGKTGGDAVAGTGFDVSLTEIRAAHESFFKNWMEA